jgi:DNA-binding XRE family transcriptional regulator
VDRIHVLHIATEDEAAANLGIAFATANTEALTRLRVAVADHRPDMYRDRVATAAWWPMSERSTEEYEDLVDARDAAIAAAQLALGEMEVLTFDQVDDYLAATTPLQFWRNHRGMTQAELAEAVGITQPYLAQIESGVCTGVVHIYASLAKALRVRIEDLL